MGLVLVGVSHGLLCDDVGPCDEMLVMKRTVTNRLGLAKPFVTAVENDPYDPDDGGTKSDYTITGLLRPPRMAAIAQTAVVTEDVADCLFALQGQLMHEMLERGGDDLEAEGWIIEKRFYKTYVLDGKSFVVSAKIDAFDPKGELTDYKYTSVAAAKHGLKNEHYWQVNFQALLLREHGFTVNTGNATILMRDWSAERTYEGYPESPSMKHVVPLVSSAEVDKWILERIRLHEAAKKELPLCTDEERWSRPKWALIKPGRKTAVKVEATRAELEAYVAENPSKAEGCTITERTGEDVRCLRYCPVRSVCQQALAKFPELSSLSLVGGEDGMVKL